MKFNIAEYLRQNEFTQTRESDKRDTFEKEYFHPFENENFLITITISYNSGFTEYNPLLIRRMEVRIKRTNTESTLYSGISPINFDYAEDLFKHILPSISEIKNYEL